MTFRRVWACKKADNVDHAISEATKAAMADADCRPCKIEVGEVIRDVSRPLCRYRGHVDAVVEGPAE